MANNKALLWAIGICVSIATWGVSSAETSAETLKIGVIAPLTGGGAPWGIAGDQAYRIAAADINAKGGLDVGGKKYQIEVVSYDDQFKTPDAITAYRRLMDKDNVKYMLLESSNGVTALKETIESDKAVVITAGFGPKVVDETNRYIFRWAAGPRDYMPEMAKWLKANLKGKTIAIVNPNIEGSVEQRVLADELYKKVGFDVVGGSNLLYEMSEKEFAPLITKVIALRPDIVDLGSSPPATAGLIVRQARELGYKGVLIKTAGPSASDIIAGAGKEASEGMINIAWSNPGHPEYQRVAAAYQKSIGQLPNDFIVAAYDSIMIMLKAIQKAGDVNDTAKVRDAIAQILPMKGMQGDEIRLGGKNTYGSDQEFLNPIYMTEVKNGVPVLVGTVK